MLTPFKLPTSSRAWIEELTAVPSLEALPITSSAPGSSGDVLFGLQISVAYSAR